MPEDCSYTPNHRAVIVSRLLSLLLKLYAVLNTSTTPHTMMIKISSAIICTLMTTLIYYISISNWSLLIIFVMVIKKISNTKTFSLISVSTHLKCQGGETRVSKLAQIPTECGMQSQYLVSSSGEAGTRCSNGSQTGRDSNKIIQDELLMIRKNLVSFLFYHIRCIDQKFCLGHECGILFAYKF